MDRAVARSPPARTGTFASRRWWSGIVLLQHKGWGPREGTVRARRAGLPGQGQSAAGAVSLSQSSLDAASICAQSSLPRDHSTRTGLLICCGGWQGWRLGCWQGNNSPSAQIR